MVGEVLAHLFDDRSPQPDEGVVDGTVGLGGHATAVLEARADCRLLGLDRDPDALAVARRRLAAFGSRVVLVHASYAELAQVLADEGLGAPSGILLDLGVSSLQLDDPERGFSFREGPGADMRFDRHADGPTALDVVNEWSERELADLLHEHGDEPRARAVARALVKARPIADGAQLLEIVRGMAWRGRRIDPATRTFQALRIAVNDEMGHLERGLEVALEALAPGGRLVVLAFHSGEDRRVKNAFREAARRGAGTVRTKKPIRPTDEEVRGNRRARPARLRAFERTTGEPGGEQGR